MEQHPVPQNVTTFQFRLIGDMTIKQFGYLCAGAILAFIAYKLPLPFIITWPLAIIFAFLGIGFAFIPVEERPMDVWVFSFFKSIYSPTQYLWNREQPKPAPSPPAHVPTPPVPKTVTPPAATAVVPPVVTGTKPAEAPAPAPATPPAPSPREGHPPHITPKTVLTDLFQPPAAEARTHAPPVALKSGHRISWWEEFVAMFRPKPRAPAAKHVAAPAPPPAAPQPSVTGLHPAAPAPAPQPASVPKPADDRQVREKMAKLEENIANLESRLTTKTTADDRILELQKQLTELLEQKNKTDDELAALRRKSIPKQEPPPSAAGTGQPQQPGIVNVITTQEGAVKAGLPRLTNVPNVITGMVKDDEGNQLPGILVTVTNNEGVPMRALKTNKLGQFAASTPLSPGTYFVEIEDPRSRFTFSRVQITLSGAVVPLLEIIAKSEKALNREKLAQEIFGRPTS